MDAARWERLVQGEGCPFDAPRPASNEYWDIAAPLTVSTLYLSTTQTYRGQCVLIFDPRHVTRPDELTAPEWAAFTADLHKAQGAVMRVTRPDHINVAALGNVIPHLHWHIIPRYQGDPRWGDPIWTTNLADMPDMRLARNERVELIAALRGALE